MTVESLYERVVRDAKDRDMIPFMPFLKEIAKGRSVLEFGVRNGVSTAGLLGGNPNKMVSVDINPFAYEAEYTEHARESNVQWEFVRSDTRSLKPTINDVLFVDTLHDYWCCDAELFRHANVTNRYILFHDTNLVASGAQGHDETRGYWIAILKLLQKTMFTADGPEKEWYLLGESKANSWGLTVLVSSPEVRCNPDKVVELQNMLQTL